MKKSDLKSGMVVKFRYGNSMFMLIDNVFCSVDGRGYVKLDSYNENMCNIKDGNQWDIVEVYKCRHTNLMYCFLENKLNLIWVRELYTDWSKVPFGTKVRCWDNNKSRAKEGKFLAYKNKSYYPFRVYIDLEDYNEEVAWKYCELVE